MKGKTAICQVQESTRLLDAVRSGDVRSLINLLQEDPLVLDRCLTAQSGDFTPLHIAAAKGYREIVQALITEHPKMIFIRDHDGMNPVHVAALNGQTDVVFQFLQAKPQVVLERTNAGETLMHLCVKYNQTETLQNLAIRTFNDAALFSIKDGDGNTVLHLAVADKQLETVKFLLEWRLVKRNAINIHGFTAMDLIVNKVFHKDEINMKIVRALRKAYEYKSEDVVKRSNEQQMFHRNALMVVASLIATMAFQVAIQPPGGNWQDNNDGHIAGLSVMADIDTTKYNLLVMFSAIGMVSSVTVILLLISGLPCNRFFMGVMMILMSIAILATTLSFNVSILFLSATSMNLTIRNSAKIVFGCWYILMIFLFCYHLVRFLNKLWYACCLSTAVFRPSWKSI